MPSSTFLLSIPPARPPPPSLRGGSQKFKAKGISSLKEEEEERARAGGRGGRREGGGRELLYANGLARPPCIAERARQRGEDGRGRARWSQGSHDRQPSNAAAAVAAAHTRPQRPKRRHFYARSKEGWEGGRVVRAPLAASASSLSRATTTR